MASILAGASALAHTAAAQYVVANLQTEVLTVLLIGTNGDKIKSLASGTVTVVGNGVEKVGKALGSCKFHFVGQGRKARNAMFGIPKPLPVEEPDPRTSGELAVTRMIERRSVFHEGQQRMFVCFEEHQSVGEPFHVWYMVKGKIPDGRGGYYDDVVPAPTAFEAAKEALFNGQVPTRWASANKGLFAIGFSKLDNLGVAKQYCCGNGIVINMKAYGLETQIGVFPVHVLEAASGDGCTPGIFSRADKGFYTLDSLNVSYAMVRVGMCWANLPSQDLIIFALTPKVSSVLGITGYKQTSSLNCSARVTYFKSATEAYSQVGKCMSTTSNDWLSDLMQTHGVIMYNTSTEAGSSGGAITDSNGRLMGMHLGSTAHPEGYNYGVSVSTIIAKARRVGILPSQPLPEVPPGLTGFMEAQESSHRGWDRVTPYDDDDVNHPDDYKVYSQEDEDRIWAEENAAKDADAQALAKDQGGFAAGRLKAKRIKHGHFVRSARKWNELSPYQQAQVRAEEFRFVDIERFNDEPAPDTEDEALTGVWCDDLSSSDDDSVLTEPEVPFYGSDAETDDDTNLEYETSLLLVRVAQGEKTFADIVDHAEVLLDAGIPFDAVYDSPAFAEHRQYVETLHQVALKASAEFYNQDGDLEAEIVGQLPTRGCGRKRKCVNAELREFVDLKKLHDINGECIKLDYVYPPDDEKSYYDALRAVMYRCRSRMPDGTAIDDIPLSDDFVNWQKRKFRNCLPPAEVPYLSDVLQHVCDLSATEKSPGWTGVYFGCTTKREILDDPIRRKTLITIVLQRLFLRVLYATANDMRRTSVKDLLHDKHFLVDPYKVFHKDEPHSLPKAEEGRWRMIWGQGLVDQILQLLFCHKSHEVIKRHYLADNHYKHCILVGLGHHDEGKKRVFELVEELFHSHPETREAGKVFFSDFQNWDMNLKEKVRRLAQEILRAQYYDSRGPGDYIHDWETRGFVQAHACNDEFDLMQLADLRGNLVLLHAKGRMSSGEAQTSVLNSVASNIVNDACYPDVLQERLMNGPAFPTALTLGDDGVALYRKDEQKAREIGAILKYNDCDAGGTPRAFDLTSHRFDWDTRDAVYLNDAKLLVGLCADKCPAPEAFAGRKFVVRNRPVLSALIDEIRVLRGVEEFGADDYDYDE